MKNFINIDVISELDKIRIYSILLEYMPNFTWRMGESDMQGGYVSGRNEAGVNIQCWVDENPISFTISFNNASLNEIDKETLIGHIAQDVLPKIGKANDINY